MVLNKKRRNILRVVSWRYFISNISLRFLIKFEGVIFEKGIFDTTPGKKFVKNILNEKLL